MINMLFLLSVLLLDVVEANVQLELTSPVICNCEAEYTCRVNASGFLRWSFRDISVSFLSTSPLEMFMNRSDDHGNYTFALTAVERNPDNSRLFDFISVFRVNATSAVNGTILECDDGVSPPAEEPLILNSTEEVINVIKPPCVCDRVGNATVNLEWGLIPVLLGWDAETVRYNIVVTSQSGILQLPNAVSPLQIPLLLDNGNYVFEITASNECGEISAPKTLSEVTDCESDFCEPDATSQTTDTVTETDTALIIGLVVGVGVGVVLILVLIISILALVKRYKYGNEHSLSQQTKEVEVSPSTGSGKDEAYSGRK